MVWAGAYGEAYWSEATLNYYLECVIVGLLPRSIGEFNYASPFSYQLCSKPSILDHDLLIETQLVCTIYDYAPHLQ